MCDQNANKRFILINVFFVSSVITRMNVAGGEGLFQFQKLLSGCYLYVNTFDWLHLLVASFSLHFLTHPEQDFSRTLHTSQW